MRPTGPKYHDTEVASQEQQQHNTIVTQPGRQRPRRQRPRRQRPRRQKPRRQKVRDPNEHATRTLLGSMAESWSDSPTNCSIMSRVDAVYEYYASIVDKLRAPVTGGTLVDSAIQLLNQRVYELIASGIRNCMEILYEQVCEGVYKQEAEHAAEGKVLLKVAWIIAQDFDQRLSAAGLPPRCRLPDADLPKDRFARLDAQAATRLQKSLEEAVVRTRTRSFDTEALQSVAEVLGDVMRPLVHSFLSGTLELIEPPEAAAQKTVADLSDEQRAALIAASRKTKALVEDGKVAAGCLIDLYEAVNEVVQSEEGLPIHQTVARQEIRNETAAVPLEDDIPFLLPIPVKAYLEGCEDGTLSLSALKEVVTLLNTVLTDEDAGLRSQMAYMMIT